MGKKEFCIFKITNCTTKSDNVMSVSELSHIQTEVHSSDTGYTSIVSKSSLL